MKKKLLLISLIFAQSLKVIGQEKNSSDENTIYTKANASNDESIKRGIPSSIQVFNSTNIKQIGEEYFLKIETLSNYTCFAIGIKSMNTNLPAGNFKFEYKMEKSPKSKEWGKLKYGEGEFTPSESTTGHYWSELFFGYDEQVRNKIYIVITPPAGLKIEEIRVDAMDLSNEIDPNKKNESNQNLEKSAICPAQPSIIARSSWCGNYTACANASYTPTIISPTHVVIHHGASPDTYTDGSAVVRSYWNYHVNTLGWADIGYNYLIDKFGNIFLGRKNANYSIQDVRGSHAGNTNDKSIGVNFLGNGDVSIPTTLQLEKLYDLLGWWFKSRNIVPNTSASIVLQSGGSAILNRIVGHKDVNIGGTACPGAVIYGLLSTIRSETLNTINACVDTVKPTTAISASSQITTDFIANFSDLDNAGGTGIHTSFYQVCDFNGTEHRSNKDHGFYNDNFNTTLHSDWISQAGNWTINQNRLNQQDNLSANTNMYTSLSQNSGNKYLYNWKMKTLGTTPNRNAGIHFFCQDATQSNRLNSYYVAIKPGENKIQIIEINNNIPTIRAEINSFTSPTIEYDYKVIFNTSNGEINVYVNDIFLISWTDITPLATGNQVSFRTSNCTATFDNFRVFKSRTSVSLISVGNSSVKEIRFQNPTATSNSGKITSICTDIAKNLSIEKSIDCKVDFWGPYILTNVNDGIGSDISIQTSLNSISANWSATSDPNNTITSYSYAIGTSPGASNILNWTNNGMNLTFTKTGLSLINGTTYYISVRSTNASGLNSTAKSSNGVLISIPKTPYYFNSTNTNNNNDNEITIYPNPVTQILHITTLEKGFHYKIYDINGKIMKEESCTNEQEIEVSYLKNGSYYLEIYKEDFKTMKRFVKL